MEIKVFKNYLEKYIRWVNELSKIIVEINSPFYYLDKFEHSTWISVNCVPNTRNYKINTYLQGWQVNDIL